MNQKVAILTMFVTCLCSNQVIGNQCNFGSIISDKKWNSCQCRTADTDGSLAMVCDGKPWLVVPSFKPDPSDFEPNDQVFDFDPIKSKNAHVIDLSIVDSSLIYLSEDSFKNQPLEKLDLSRNQIEKIHLNAFKGLENRLIFLSLDSNQVSKLPVGSTSFLDQLQYLQIRHNAIDRIESAAFEGSHLRNLRALHLDHNLIDELSVKAFSDLPLHVLTLENNKIRTVHATSLPKGLQHLNMKGNFLTEIPYDALSTCTDSIETLDFEGNNITNLASRPDLNFLKNLTLNLANNRIEFLDSNAFSCFGSVATLDLSHNQLTFVHETALRGVKFLENLDLSYNKLSNLHFSTFSDLSGSVKRLNAEENDFHDVPSALQSLNSLEFLNMKSNRLFRLDDKIFKSLANSLKNLQLSYNRLTDQPLDILVHLHTLEILDLSKNEIENLDSPVFKLQQNWTSQNLAHLNLAGNRIKSVLNPHILSIAQNLISLDFSNNFISRIGVYAFQGMDRLENLFLQNNLMETFPDVAFKKIPKLRRLILDSNRLMDLPSGALAKMNHLEHFSLRNNRLQAIVAKSFPHEELTSLKTINMALNYISFLAPRTFSNLPSLQAINLQANHLHYLSTYSFYNLTNLRGINLSGNRLSKTHQLAFFDLPRLEHVNLNENFLEKIESGTFSDVPRLETVDLSKNKFVKFESQYLYRLKFLKRLDLSYNRLTNFELEALKSSLEILNLNHNQLQAIGEQTFAGYVHLRRLDLSENFINDMHYKALFTAKKLNHVDLSRNNLGFIRKLAFSQQENLEKLDLSENLIRKLEPACFGRDNLHNLDLSRNKLDSVPYFALETVKHSLSQLNLGNNFVMFLESIFFEGLKNLSFICLKGNKIQRIEEASFKGMRSLRNLDLSDNPIIDWHPNSFRDISSSIESINLAKTGLASLPVITQRGLKHLNVSRNTLYTLDESDTQLMGKLENFDLSFNRISSLNKAALKPLANLKRANFSRNPIASIDSDHFLNLHKLESLDFHEMPNLIRFDMTSLKPLKNLKELTIYGFPELVDNLNFSTLLHNVPPLRRLHVEVQDFSLKNQLSVGDSRFLRNLRINGGRNLKFIAPDAFQNFRGHELTLSLQFTGIKHLSSRIFEAMNRVAFLKLDLRHNQLETVNFFKSHEPPLLNGKGTILADLWLDGNPLICDCHLSWVKKWLAYVEKTTAQPELEKRIFRWNKTTCFAPETFKGMSVARVDFDAMGCSNSTACTRSTNVFSLLTFFVFCLLFCTE